MTAFLGEKQEVSVRIVEKASFPELEVHLKEQIVRCGHDFRFRCLNQMNEANRRNQDVDVEDLRGL